MAKNPDSFNLDAALERARRIMWLLAGAGTLVFLGMKGPLWAGSFFTGALVSLLNFHFTQRFVKSVGADGNARPAMWKNVLLGLRYPVMGAALYAMMKLFGINILVSLCGLLVPIAAILLESLYELIHGT